MTPALVSLDPSRLRNHPAKVGRILFLIDRLEVLGGAERALLEMTSHLPAIGYECAVVTFTDRGGPNIVGLFDCPTYLLQMRRSYGVSGFRCALELRRVIQNFKPDIVHTFFETSDTWGSVVSRLCGVPAIVSSRRDMGILRTAKHRTLYKILRRNFDRVLTVSDAVRQFCIEADGIPPGQVFTVYNGVTEPRFDPNARALIRARHNLPYDTPLVVTLANVRRIKGIDTLLETGALVCKQVENVAFLVVGAISEPDYFRELKSNPLFTRMKKRFIFAGASSEAGTYLRSADVFCMLSRSEGFSNALLEAMSCGLPAVVTKVGGNSEALIDGEHGFLVPVGDSGAAAKHIVDLLLTRSLRDRIGASAKHRANLHFSTDTMICRLGEIYARLIGSYAAPRTEISEATF